MKKKPTWKKVAAAVLAVTVPIWVVPVFLGVYVWEMFEELYESIIKVL